MRKLISLLVCLVWIGSTYAQNTDIQIDELRIQDNRFALSQLSNTPKDNHQNEINKTTLEGRDLLMRLMRYAGLMVRVDYAGNIIGTRSGWDPTFRPITIGCNLNAQAFQKDLDGIENTLVSIEVIETLMDEEIYTDHPLELIIFFDEQQGGAGSQALVNQLDQQYLAQTNSLGMSRHEAISQLGGHPEKLDKVVRAPGTMAAFLELLDTPISGALREQEDLVIVDRMIEEHQWSLTIERELNPENSDKVDNGQFTVNDINIYLQELTANIDDTQHVRLGQIRELITTSIHSMGKLQTTLTIQNQSKEKADKLFQQLAAKAQSIEKDNGIKISFEKLPVNWAQKLDPQLQEVIANTARTQGLIAQNTDAGTNNKAHELSGISRSAAVIFPDLNGDEANYTAELKERAEFLLKTILEIDLALRKSSSPIGGN